MNFWTFPGSGDRDKLKEDKKTHGDLLIYHEIMAFILANQEDAILCKRYNQKRLAKINRSFPHYIVNAYRLTGRMVYSLKSNLRDYAYIFRGQRK